MPCRIAAVLLASSMLALAACSGGNGASHGAAGNDAAQNDVASAPVSDNAVENAAGARATAGGDEATGPLSAYIGKHPSEKLSGLTFLEQPQVKAAVEQTVPDAEVRDFIFHYNGPDAPIVAKAGRILAWGCERHNCGYHNWAVSVLPDGSSPEICFYHDDEHADGAAHWFLPGGKAETRSGNCPSE